jgi:GntR family transcriptional regulator/MocR family aminotransferase
MQGMIWDRNASGVVRRTISSKFWPSSGSSAPNSIINSLYLLLKRTRLSSTSKRAKPCPISSISFDQRGRFIYSAALALTVGPGLRIGFLVLPPKLVNPALDALRLLDHASPCQSQGAPWLDQTVLCDFPESGGYQKHLRRLRKTYMARRDALVRALQHFFGPCDLSGTASGTHVILRLPVHLPGAQTCQALARSAGIKFNTMMFETVTGPELLPDRNRCILLGHADLSERVIQSAVKRPVNVWQ